MLHTFVGHDEAAVGEIVRQPIIEYLNSSVDLVKGSPGRFPAFAAPGRRGERRALDLDQLTAQELDDAWTTPSSATSRRAACSARPTRASRWSTGWRRSAWTRSPASSTSGSRRTRCSHTSSTSTACASACARPSRRRRPAGLAALVARHGVTHLQCTPSLARLLLADPGRARRWARCGSCWSAASSCRAGGGAAGRLPTGDCTTCTGRRRRRCGRRDDVAGRRRPVPIGRPIANTQLYVLDARREPVPVGTPGELYIGGAGRRARVPRAGGGDRRALRTRPIPGPGGRLYRTGDLVR